MKLHSLSYKLYISQALRAILVFNMFDDDNMFKSSYVNYYVDIYYRFSFLSIF